MNDPYYSIEQCEEILNRYAKLTGIISAVILLLSIACVIWCIILIEKKKTLKARAFAILDLFIVICVACILLYNVAPQFISTTRDIREQSYIQYEGPATIISEEVVDYNSFSWWTKYYASFKHNGKTIEARIYGHEECDHYDKVYITYGKHSKYAIQFDIVEP